MKEHLYQRLIQQKLVFEEKSIQTFHDRKERKLKDSMISCYKIDDHIHLLHAKLKMDRPYYLSSSNKLFIISYIIKGKKIVNVDQRPCLDEGYITYLLLDHDKVPLRMRFFSYESLSFVIDMNKFYEMLSHTKADIAGLEMNCQKEFFAYEKENVELKKIFNLILTHPLNSISDFIYFKHLLYESLVLTMELRQQKCHHCPRFSYKKDFVIEAERIIFRHLHEVLFLEDIAESLQISVSSLQSYFKEIKGVTVYQFIRQAKIEHSKYYLEQTDMPIIDIAQNTGYENPSKYASTFKSFTGFTPSQYRKAFHKN